MNTSDTTTSLSSTRQQPGRELKQERARRTREQILWAAAEEFKEKGYPTVTLQHVATRTGLTKGAVYFHYTNKEALAVAVVEEHYARWEPLVTEVRESERSPLEIMLTVLDRTAELFRDDTMVQAGARLQIERSLIKADLPQPYVGWQELLTSLAAAAVEAGQLRPGTSPDALARVIVAAFFGTQHISDVLTGRADLMARYVELRDIIFAGVTA
ncbi:ScbR family autoregulator-binding transcription factor [Streptomyces sp. NPDC060028]|uniref:ScbR family autoregulator-binding transcription factor n=1 Tax=Streptomyces sp. NPDC060028 TaxID=3347041 RepID=UPI0036D061D5